MINDLWLIGIGTGSLSHLTGEGLQALREAQIILVPRKGADKDDLASIRLKLIEDAKTDAEVVFFEYPTRDPELPYIERVAAWHREIGERWQAALDGRDISGPVALLIWGDPSLYDSTMRIAERLRARVRMQMQVIPGITSIQALTAAHGVPLNGIGAPVQITTGRRLRDHGWPEGCDTLVIMLDGDCSFQSLEVPEEVMIHWSAYAGMENEINIAGRLSEVQAEILATRASARADHGWIMDIYLLQRLT